MCAMFLWLIQLFSLFKASTGRFQQTNGFLSDNEMVKWSQKWLVEGFQPKLVSKGVNLWNKSKKYLEDKVNYRLAYHFRLRLALNLFRLVEFVV